MHILRRTSRRKVCMADRHMYHVVLRAKGPNAGESSINIIEGEEIPERLNYMYM